LTSKLRRSASVVELEGDISLGSPPGRTGPAVSTGKAADEILETLAGYPQADL
jgi:hypothetical protein